MKPIRDPFQRARLLDLLKTGLDMKDAVAVMDTPGITLATIKRERKEDPLFDDAVVNAQAAAFAPALRRLLHLATYGDEEADITRTAMTLVVQHYNKALDREHDLTKIQAQRDNLPVAQSLPTLTTPGQVAELVVALTTAMQERDTIELESEEADDISGRGEVPAG